MKYISIHDNFKNELKKINIELYNKIFNKSISELENQEIILSMINFFNTNIFYKSIVLNHTNGSNNVGEIFNGLDYILSIDDEYIWTPNRLYNYLGLASKLNTLYEYSNQEKKLIAGKVYRICAINKLSLINKTYFRDHIGKLFEFVGYKHDDVIQYKRLATYDDRDILESGIFKDEFENIYEIPESVVVPTAITNLKEHKKIENIKEIRQRLENSKKINLEKLSQTYQEKLRDFMDISRLMSEAITKDPTEDAEKIYNIQTNFKETMMKCSDIFKIDHEFGNKIIIETNDLISTGYEDGFEDEDDYDIYYESVDCPNIGSYIIDINLVNFSIKIKHKNNGNNEYHHPHINAYGEPCFGDYVNPLREARNKQDYITLTYGLLDFLKHYNEDSPYVSLAKFYYLLDN